MKKLSTTAVLVAAGLITLAAGCAAPPPQVPEAMPPPAIVPPPTRDSAESPSVFHYRCDNRTDFSVRFADDTALMDLGALGTDKLLRDAGGVTPQQSVYSNARVRAEFGLGASTREAVLHYLAPAQDVKCARD